MWRREERLGYWLSGVQLSSKPALLLRLREKFAQRFQPQDFPNIVKEPLLCVDSKVGCVRDALLETANIKDGLDSLSPDIDDPAAQGHEFEKSSSAVHPISLLDMAVAQTLRLPDAQGARIKQPRLTIDSYFRWLRVSLAAAVHTPEYLQFKLPAFGRADSLIAANPAIRSVTTRIAMIPHRRASIDVNTLKASDYEGFLNEAKVLKGIPADRSELLGVFRHVPVEVISRLRYLAEEKAIIYSISSASNRTRTRVHDVAAVRDASSREIHLVPHRTRYQTVFLN
jgi:hypothetical protein